MRCWIVPLTVGILASPAATLPAAADTDVGVALQIGTYGAGADVAFGIHRHVAIRGSFRTLDVDDSFDEGGIEYDGTVDIGGLGLFVDVMPTGGAFRLTAGLVDNANEIRLDATPTTPQEIGGTVYDPAEIGVLRGRVEFDDQAPYLGLGFGNVARGKRFGFVLDAGFVFQGSGDVGLTSSTGLVSAADLEQEIREIEDDLSDYDLWPVLSFGVAFRF